MFSKHKYLMALLLAVVFMGSSCRFYKVVNVSSSEISAEKAVYSDKFILVHSSEGLMLLRYPALSEDRAILTGHAAMPGPMHQFYRSANKFGSTPYQKRNGDPGNEIHLYVSEIGFDENSDKVYIPVESITRMEIYKTQPGLGIATTAISVIAGLYASMILIAILVWTLY